MAENILPITSSDPSTTEQYLDTFRRSEHLEPERALIIAVLEDAVHEYRKYIHARDAQGKERFREAHRWIMESEDDWIFSFNSICALLGLDPDYVRRGVRAAKGESAAKERQPHATRRRAA